MSGWGQPGGEPSRYPDAVDPNVAPPAYGPPPAPYQQSPYQSPYQLAAYPQYQHGGYVYPAYPQQPTNPWAYPQPVPGQYGPGQYGPGQYGPYQQRNRRPGTAIASAVLGYVNGGALVLAGLLLLFSASLVTEFDDPVGSPHHYSTELAVDGFLNFIAAGLVIAGAIMLTGHNPVGRLLYTIGEVIVLGEAIYWLVRFNELTNDDVALVNWAVLFIALSVVGLALTWTPSINRWMADPG